MVDESNQKCSGASSDRPSVEAMLGVFSIAFGLVAVFSVLSFMYWDLAVAKWAVGLPDWFFVSMDWLTKLGEGWVWLVPTGVVAGWFFLVAKNLKAGMVWTVIFAAVALTGILTNIIKILVGRYRPKGFFEHGWFGFTPMKVGYVFNSMPSGHSTTSGAILAVLWLYFPQWRWLTVPCCLVLASTRIWVRAHYISDVLTGLLVGASVTFLIYYVVVGAGWIDSPCGWKRKRLGSELRITSYEI